MQVGGAVVVVFQKKERDKQAVCTGGKGPGIVKIHAREKDIWGGMPANSTQKNPQKNHKTRETPRKYSYKSPPIPLLDRKQTAVFTGWN